MAAGPARWRPATSPPRAEFPAPRGREASAWPACIAGLLAASPACAPGTSSCWRASAIRCASWSEALTAGYPHARPRGQTLPRRPGGAGPAGPAGRTGLARARPVARTGLARPLFGLDDAELQARGRNRRDSGAAGPGRPSRPGVCHGGRRCSLRAQPAPPAPKVCSPPWQAAAFSSTPHELLDRILHGAICCPASLASAPPADTRAALPRAGPAARRARPRRWPLCPALWLCACAQAAARQNSCRWGAGGRQLLTIHGAKGPGG